MDRFAAGIVVMLSGSRRGRGLTDRPVVVVSFTLLALGLLTSFGCASTFGLDWESSVVACIHDSDCEASLRCISGQCAGPDASAATVDATADDVADASPLNAAGETSPDLPDAQDSTDEPSACGDTAGSVDNCGSCGHRCTGQHVSWTCAASACVTNGCESGWGDCNGSLADGCETDLTSDTANCGVCGHACTSNICDDSHVCAPNVCNNSVCRGLIVPGLLDTAGPSSLTGQLDSLIGYEVYVSPGWLTAFGVITDLFGDMLPDGGDAIASPHGYIGLYTNDGNGFPKELVAVADTGDPVTIAPGTSQIFPVTPPVQVSAGYYWIVFVFDANVLFNATPGAMGSTRVVYDPNPVYPNSTYSLPSMAPATTVYCDPTTSPPCDYEPALYIVVAQ
jgi:hypothetical protein